MPIGGNVDLCMPTGGEIGAANVDGMSEINLLQSGSAAAPDLVSWLRSRSDAELARLLRVRPDLAHPVPSDVRLLGVRASGRISVDLALDRLDLGSIVLTEALALLPEPTSLTELTGLLEVADAELRPVLARLREFALVWGPDDELHLLPAVRDLLPFPAGLGPPARIALAGVPPARLPHIQANLSELLGEPPPAADADDAEKTLTRLLEVFEDPQRLAEALAAVPARPREVLDLLAAGPPVGRTTGALRPVDAATADSPLRWLLAHGLLVPLDDYTVVLPRELGVLLRGGRPLPDASLRPPPLPLTAHQPAEVDATAAGQALIVLRLVESLLEAWALDPPGVLRSGGVGVRELRRAARLLDADERTTALVVEVAHAAGLLGIDERGESWLPTAGSASYDSWLAKPPAQRWCDLAASWLATTRVPALVGRRPAADDGSRTGPAPNALGPEVDRTLAPVVRADLIRLLAAAEPGAAPAGTELDDAGVWCSPRRAGELRRELATWCREDAELLGVTGRGALSSFGRLLVGSLFDADDEIGAATDDSLDADAKAAAADALALLLPEPLDHVLVQADLTAIAPGPLQPELRRELALLADVESTGGATVYRFSASSIRRALDAGRTAAEIHALLKAKSRTPIPQPLSYLIDDTARRHGRIRVGTTGSYVRCDDEAVLRELLANRRLADLLLRELAPTVLVSPLAAELVLQRLREAAYAPAAESAAGAVLSGGPQPRRAPTRPRPPARHIGVLPGSVAVSAVRAIRAGDRALTAALAPPRSTVSDTVAILREAAAAGVPLWLGYLNAQGQASNRIVEPLRIGGGYLTAFDHRHEEVRTFAVHRITGVGWLDADDDAV